MIYYVVAGLLLLFAGLPRGQARLVAGWLAVLMLAALGGLRFEVGTDWDAYLDVFNLVGQGESYSELREENGFLSTISLFQIFSHSYPAFVFVFFCFSFSLKLYAITKFRADLTVSLIVYFFSAFLIYDVNGLRQGMAMGFVLCAGWFAVQARALPFVLAMAVAISMHTVAAVALPIYWMSNSSWLRRQSLGMRYIFATVTVLTAYASSLILASTDATIYLDAINLTSRYNHYLENFDRQFSPLGLGSLQRIFILGLALHLQSRLICTPRVSSMLVNSYLAATFIYFSLSFNVEFMARVSYYYKIFDIILISIMFRSLRRSTEALLFYCLLATLLFGSLYQILNISDGGLLPYRSQLSN